MASGQLLLDVTDTAKRRLQHGAVFAGVLVLISAKAAAGRPEGAAMALLIIAIGLALFGVAMSIKQRWSVTYKGHDVRYENNPFTGEKLFVDGVRGSKGKLGYRSEMRGVIASGDGAGDTVVVQTEAGLLSLKCRITAEPAVGTDAIPPAVSNEQLLAEVRRRGLT